MENGEHEPTTIQVAAWRAFLTAHARITEQLERELMAGPALPLAWYDVLVQLSEAAQHQLRMHDLARAVLLSRAGLTRLVDRMTAAGLVERIACPEDRRGTYVALTQRGFETLREAAPVHLAGIQRHFASRLDAEETAQVQAIMERLAAVTA